MKLPVLAIALLFPLLLSAQTAPKDGGLFDFSDLDVKPSDLPKEESSPAPAPDNDPLSAYPGEVKAILEKLKTYESVQRTKLHTEVSAARKVAAEILARKAATASPGERTTLLGRATWIENLPPHEVLSGAPGNPVGEPSWFLDSWKCTEWGWTNLHAAGGDVYRKGRVRGHWRWLDRSNQICVFNYDDGYVEVWKFESQNNPVKARIVTMGASWSWTERKAAKQTSGIAPKPAKDDPVAKLAANEAVQRQKFEALVASKKSKVAAWMLQMVPKLPAPQIKLVVEEAARLEKKVSADALKPGDAFAGAWQWMGKTLEFREGGVVHVGGKKAGVRLEGRGDYRILAFTFDGGKSAAIGRLSGDDKNLLRVYDVSGGKSDAVRK